MKLANEDLQRLTFELLRARQSEGNERCRIAAQALQQRLEIAEERAQLRKKNASRLESKRVVAEQMVASMKNAMQDAQIKKRKKKKKKRSVIDIACFGCPFWNPFPPYHFQNTRRLDSTLTNTKCSELARRPRQYQKCRDLIKSHRRLLCLLRPISPRFAGKSAKYASGRWWTHQCHQL